MIHTIKMPDGFEQRELEFKTTLLSLKSVLERGVQAQRASAFRFIGEK